MLRFLIAQQLIRSLTDAYTGTVKDLGLDATAADAEAFGQSVPSWPAFPDSADALKRLSDMGLKLIILSNVHNAGFAESRKKLEKGYKFDAVYTAENSESVWGVTFREWLPWATSAGCPTIPGPDLPCSRLLIPRTRIRLFARSLTPSRLLQARSA